MIDDNAHRAALLAPRASANVTTGMSDMVDTLDNAGTPCPDDAFLYALVTGSLDGDALTTADVHLDECESCRAVVVELSRAMAPEPVGVALRRGELAGRFVILGGIGRGGMGVVYQAFDPELDRKVAIKVVRPELASHEGASRERLLIEARAMARLAHPNVVGIYEVGELDDSVFLAMEYVDGVTLRQWLAQPRSARDIVDVFIQAGRGLAAAHATGMVHRDFKPDNVLIGPDGRARVTDFGLARGLSDAQVTRGLGDARVTRVGDDVADPAMDETLLAGTPVSAGTTAAGTPASAGTTAAGTSVGAGTTAAGTPASAGTMAAAGTPAYMALECLDGEVADHRSDQYSFCVALYEALYGQRPFQADSLDELHSKLASDDPAPPRRPHSGRVWRVIERGLCRAPARRFESMDALLEKLTASQRARRWTWAWAAAALAALACVAVLIATRGDHAAAASPCTGAPEIAHNVWNDARTDELRRALVRAAPYATRAADAAIATIDAWRDDWIDAHTETCRATRVTGSQSEGLLDIRMHCLNRRLGEIDALIAALTRPAGPDSGDPVDVDLALAELTPIAECADVDSLTAIEPAPAHHRDALARVYELLDDATADAAVGRFASALGRARAAVAQAEAIGYEPATAEALVALANALRGAADLDEAEATALRAVWTATASRADRTAARAWISLVAIAGERGRYEQAARVGEHARAHVRRIGSPARLDAMVQHSLGVVFYNLTRYDDAAQALGTALELKTREYGPDHPDVARTLTGLGNLDRARGEFPAALADHRRALAIDRAALGPAHPRVAGHLHNIAGVLRLTGDASEAQDLYLRALAIKQGALGDDHPDTALTHNSLGLTYLDAGELDRAEAAFRRALAVFEATGHGHLSVARANLELVQARKRAARPVQPRNTAKPRPPKPPTPAPGGAYMPNQTFENP